MSAPKPSAMSGRSWAWWRALNARQQLAVVALGGVLAATLVLTQILEPLLESRSEARAQLAYHQATLEQLQRAKPQIERWQQQSGPAPAQSGQSLLSVADETARAAGLAGALSRIEPSAANAVNVWLDGARFDEVMDWLAGLSFEQAVEVERLSVNRSQQADRVDVRVSLTRGP